MTSRLTPILIIGSLLTLSSCTSSLDSIMGSTPETPPAFETLLDSRIETLLRAGDQLIASGSSQLSTLSTPLAGRDFSTIRALVSIPDVIIGSLSISADAQRDDQQRMSARITASGMTIMDRQISRLDELDTSFVVSPEEIFARLDSLRMTPSTLLDPDMMREITPYMKKWIHIAEADLSKIQDDEESKVLRQIGENLIHFWSLSIEGRMKIIQQYRPITLLKENGMEGEYASYDISVSTGAIMGFIESQILSGSGISDEIRAEITEEIQKMASRLTLTGTLKMHPTKLDHFSFSGSLKKWSYDTGESFDLQITSNNNGISLRLTDDKKRWIEIGIQHDGISTTMTFDVMGKFASHPECEERVQPKEETDTKGIFWKERSEPLRIPGSNVDIDTCPIAPIRLFEWSLQYPQKDSFSISGKYRPDIDRGFVMNFLYTQKSESFSGNFFIEESEPFATWSTRDIWEDSTLSFSFSGTTQSGSLARLDMTADAEGMAGSLTYTNSGGDIRSKLTTPMGTLDSIIDYRDDRLSRLTMKLQSPFVVADLQMREDQSKKDWITGPLIISQGGKKISESQIRLMMIPKRFGLGVDFSMGTIDEKSAKKWKIEFESFTDIVWDPQTKVETPTSDIIEWSEIQQKYKGK